MYTFTIPASTQFKEWNIIHNSGSGTIYYVIQKGYSSVQLDSNNRLSERNFMESHIDLSDGSHNLLDDSSNREYSLKGGYYGISYVVIFYIIDDINLSLIHI